MIQEAVCVKKKNFVKINSPWQQGRPQKEEEIQLKLKVIIKINNCETNGRAV